MFENLKVSTKILSMAILAVFFTIIIAIVGYYYMYSFNYNVADIHTNGVKPLAEASIMSSEFIKIILYAVKARNEYDVKYAENIIISDKLIRNSLKEFLSGKVEADEKVSMDNFSRDYEVYMKNWSSWNDTLKGGNKVSIEDYNNQAILGGKIDDNIDAFKSEQILHAGLLKDSSQKKFSDSILVFIGIIVIVLVVFISVSYFIIRTINKSSKRLIENLDRIASGDFTVNINTTLNTEFGKMDRALAESISNISNMMHVVKEKCLDIDNRSDGIYAVSNQIESSTEEVTKAIQEVANGTNIQASNLVDTTSSLDKFGNELDLIVESIKEIDLTSKNISTMANDSNEKMLNLITSTGNVKKIFGEFETKIEGFGDNINQIHDITNVITNIAAQTNLLALNAAIEAARAGESGKGFTVVAEEIRKLAEQSKISLENVNKLINDISSQTNIMVKTSDGMNSEINNQVEVVKVSLDSFKHIINAVESVIPKIAVVTKSAENVEKQKDKLVDKVKDISVIAEEVSSSSEEIASSSEEIHVSTEAVNYNAHELSNMTKLMIIEINKFKLVI